MRDRPTDRIEDYRLISGAFKSRRGQLGGAFRAIGPHTDTLRILSSGVDHQYGWEHVSVSLEDRCPDWAEMCWVKDQFWTEDECVVQYHPAKKDYVNHHPYCLHLWKPLRFELPTPPTILIGPK